MGFLRNTRSGRSLHILKICMIIPYWFTCSHDYAVVLIALTFIFNQMSLRNSKSKSFSPFFSSQFPLIMKKTYYADFLWNVLEIFKIYVILPPFLSSFLQFWKRLDMQICLHKRLELTTFQRTIYSKHLIALEKHNAWPSCRNTRLGNSAEGLRC